MEDLKIHDHKKSLFQPAKANMYSFILVFFLLCLSFQTTSLIIRGNFNDSIKPHRAQLLQDIVTWDEHSLFVRGQRVLFYSGEFHPFRLPVPGLWLDVFQKIKALGFTAVSFYVDWALVEGQEGNFTADGVFALEPFFAAASEAGIYLLARPGPYINAEVSGGGFPGWLARKKAVDRTPDFLPYTNNYIQNIGRIIAKAQITNGGPVILLQPENEYSQATTGTIFPNHAYFQAVEDQYRDAGIVVPFISNDAAPYGYFAPGTGEGAVDIYGHDGYPLGFDCANPYTWPDNAIPTNYHTLHIQQSPSNPFSLVEFQGGSFDPWGGSSFTKCAELLNQEFERVFNKNNYAVGVTIFSIYMVYGGTNAMKLGHPGGYTSYDYGAMIAEDRSVNREKYSEAKLEANFLKASPAYLTAVAGNSGNGSFVNTDAIATTPLVGNITSFYIVRQAAYNSLASVNYKLTVPTSAGTIIIPQLSPSLTLNGRDSKIHVTDYDIGGTMLLYSSAEIFTWKKFGTNTVLVLYGGPGETHEAAFRKSDKYRILEGNGVVAKNQNGILILNWAVTPARKIVQIETGLYVYLLDRNDAYNYWVLDLPGPAPAYNFTIPTASSVIIRAGYLLRTAAVNGDAITLTGDLNTTTTIEVIGGAPSNCLSLTFNGESIPFMQNRYGVVTGTVNFAAPNFSLPILTSLAWKSVDSLPEIQPTYDDSDWPNADIPYSNNTVYNLSTPKSLYASDYGFNTGNLLFRGHFIATGAESIFYIETQGGTAYGASVFLNNTFLGSWPGIDAASNYNQSLTLPNLRASQSAVITVLQDHMGLDEDNEVGTDGNKDPRGILNYALSGRNQSAITWKITGNLGGEDYRDKTRGPLNEGGLYAERLGYHLPDPPSQEWKPGKPTDGIPTAGVAFYSVNFDLDMPIGYDIPLAFKFTNSTTNGSAVSNYRVQLYANGYDFGKYVNNIGPQTLFPVPEGILNYHGSNTLGLSLWALDADGAKVEDIQLVSTAIIQTAYGPVELSPMPAYSPRIGAY